ncbi:MAG: hypothetical protein AB8G22_23385 [Saprospiraceae bacterium]
MKYVILFLLLFGTNLSFTQQQIHFTNPSFEDTPRHSRTPTGWCDYGNINESPPDTHPTKEHAFGVKQLPQHGKTYLGMVVRENDTQESVGQQLESPLVAGNCYSLTLYLSRSDEYISLSRTANQEIKSNSPVVLRIWGGDAFYEKKELLDSSELVAHTDWRNYEFNFRPEQEVEYLIFEVFYETPTLFPYNGNMLLDNLSSIALRDCLEVDDSLKED